MSVTRVTLDSVPFDIQSSSFPNDLGPQTLRTILPQNSAICSLLPLNSVTRWFPPKFPYVTERPPPARTNISLFLYRKPLALREVVLNLIRGKVPS